MSFIGILCSLIHFVRFFHFDLSIKGRGKENLNFIAFFNLVKISMSSNLSLEAICIRVKNRDRVKGEHLGAAFTHRHDKRLSFVID